MNYVRRIDIEDENIESVWIEVHLKSHFRLLCGFIYRSPSEKSSWIINFEKKLFKAKKVSQNLILVGDFNMNLYNLYDHLRWSMMTQSFDLLQKVEKATRVTANTTTLIDHICIQQT